MVRLAERQALAGESHREVRRDHLFARRGRAHRLALRDQAGDDAGEDRHGAGRGVGRVEHRLLVLLQVLLVAGGKPLQQDEQPHEVAVDAGRLAPHELERVRVLLLRHQARARGEGLGQGDEAVLGAGEVDEVLGHPREVRLQLRAARDELDREVAVHDRVERGGGDGGEPEVAGHRLAVEGQRRPRERPRAERHHVDPHPRVAQPRVVAHDRPRVGGRPVPERHHLGRAGVRIARHDRVGAGTALLDEGAHETGRPVAQPVDGAPDEEAQGRDRLLVAAAAEVRLPGDLAHDLGEPLLDEAVHVLHVEREIRGVGRRPGQHLLEPLLERLGVVRADRAAPAESPHPRPRRGHFLDDQPPVEREGAIERPERGVRARLVVPAPELHGHLVRCRAWYASSTHFGGSGSSRRRDGSPFAMRKRCSHDGPKRPT